MADIFRGTPVIPVVTVADVRMARVLAEALVAGGLHTIEVTLRTEAALEVIREMSRVPGAIIGAGTVLGVRDLEASQKAGAQFVVSPGLTETLGRVALGKRMPLLPGIANSSDIMRGLELGFDHFKFFPAEASGGLPALSALAAPFSRCRFCPTGGITEETAPAWLGHPNVFCVGGSWIVPKEFDAAEVRRRAQHAASMVAFRSRSTVLR